MQQKEKNVFYSDVHLRQKPWRLSRAESHTSCERKNHSLDLHFQQFICIFVKGIAVFGIDFFLWFNVWTIKTTTEQKATLKSSISRAAKFVVVQPMSTFLLLLLRATLPSWYFLSHLKCSTSTENDVHPLFLYSNFEDYQEILEQLDFFDIESKSCSIFLLSYTRNVFLMFIYIYFSTFDNIAWFNYRYQAWCRLLLR